MDERNHSPFSVSVEDAFEKLLVTLESPMAWHSIEALQASTDLSRSIVESDPIQTLKLRLVLLPWQQSDVERNAGQEQTTRLTNLPVKGSKLSTPRMRVVAILTCILYHVLIVYYECAASDMIMSVRALKASVQTLLTHRNELEEFSSTDQEASVKLSQSLPRVSSLTSTGRTRAEPKTAAPSVLANALQLVRVAHELVHVRFCSLWTTNSDQQNKTAAFCGPKTCEACSDALRMSQRMILLENGELRGQDIQGSPSVSASSSVVLPFSSQPNLVRFAQELESKLGNETIVSIMLVPLDPIVIELQKSKFRSIALFCREGFCVHSSPHTKTLEERSDSGQEGNPFPMSQTYGCCRMSGALRGSGLGAWSAVLVFPSNNALELRDVHWPALVSTFQRIAGESNDDGWTSKQLWIDVDSKLGTVYYFASIAPSLGILITRPLLGASQKATQSLQRSSRGSRMVRMANRSKSPTKRRFALTHLSQILGSQFTSESGLIQHFVCNVHESMSTERSVSNLLHWLRSIISRNKISNAGQAALGGSGNLSQTSSSTKR